MYQIKPTATTNKILKYSNKEKIIIIILLIILYSSSGIINTYFGIFEGNLYHNYYINLFIYNIFSIIFFMSAFYFMGKAIKGKGKYIDVLLIFIISFIPFIISTYISIITEYEIGISIMLISFIWFLYIVSKGLETVEKISATKITVCFVLAVVISYIINGVVFDLLGLGII